MLKDREKLYQLYHTMLSMALTWALILVINQYFVLRVPFILSALFSFIPAILISGFYLNRKNLISYIIIGGSIVLFALILWLMKINPVHWGKDFIHWCSVYNGTELLYRAHFAKSVILLSAIAGAIFFYLIIKREVTKVCLAVIIIAMLFVLSLNKINVSKAMVGISIFYILTVLVELYGIIYSKKVDRQDKKEGILYLIPVCLILAILASGLPSKSEPIRWTFVKKTYNNIVENIQLIKVDWKYSFGGTNRYFSISGFSDDGGKLGDGKKLSRSTRVALKTTGLEKGSKVYLIGAVSEVYTGHGWEKSDTQFLQGQQDYRLDYLETIYALSRQKVLVLENNFFLRQSRVRLTYGKIKTKSLFYPLKTVRIVNQSDYGIKDESSQISFNRGRGKGTNYDIEYYDVNLESDSFKNMLRKSDSFTYDKIPTISPRVVNLLSGDTLTNEKIFDLKEMINNYKLLKQREQAIETTYTQLPAQLPDRVKQLALKITSGYDNNYDKLKALESYLIQYKYSLETNKYPEDQDFVDYFLFDEKKGYCTSFATSMAVLGRCIGIPTRYVEGYAATMDEVKGGAYVIRNNKAHAWAEAYIKGFGWIPFEATAPFFNNRYTKWRSEPKPTEGPKAPPSTSYYSKPHQPYIPDKFTPVIHKKDHKEDIWSGVMISFAVIFCAILVILVYYNLLKLRYQREFKKADYSKKMYILFLRILRLLKKSGYPLEQQETIQMLAARVKNHYQYEELTFQSIANIFMKYRYAELEVTEKEFEKVEVFYTKLYEQYSEGQNKFKLWLKEFAFLAKRKKW